MTPQQDQQSSGLRTIALSAIEVAEGFNPRADVEGSGVDELARSIERRGMIVPIVVAPAGDGEYRLVDGERRVRAAAKLGLMEVPAIVRVRRSGPAGSRPPVGGRPARGVAGSTAAEPRGRARGDPRPARKASVPFEDVPDPRRETVRAHALA